MSAQTESALDSRAGSPGVAEDWENVNDDDDAMSKQLEQRFKQVKLLQREKADKEAREEAREEEAKACEAARLISSASDASMGSMVSVQPTAMKILRRPKSDQNMEELEKLKKEQAAKSAKSLEERQAAYDEARSRILGSDYKPEPSTTNVAVTVVNRSKSPEMMIPRYSPEYLISHEYVPVVSTMPQHMIPVNTSMMMQQPLYSMPPTTVPSAQMFAYIDTSRPPPPMLGGQFYPPPIAPSMNINQSQPPPPVPFGRPPMAIYPPGSSLSVAAAMRVMEPAGQTQSQRKNRQRKNKLQNGI